MVDSTIGCHCDPVVLVVSLQVLSLFDRLLAEGWAPCGTAYVLAIAACRYTEVCGVGAVHGGWNSQRGCAARAVHQTFRARCKRSEQ